MNNHTDLIERLEDDLHTLDERLHSADYELYNRLHDSISLALEALESMQAPLADDVKQAIQGLDEAATFYVNRSPVATGEEIGLANKCQEGINMLERLARERDGLEKENKRLDAALADAREFNDEYKKNILRMMGIK